MTEIISLDNLLHLFILSKHVSEVCLFWQFKIMVMPKVFEVMI